ncbi:YD repeat-containing protein [Oribacterium sp. KHPX15]|uniref:Ltp family lipoprotein n=1 Tax=Oribacterium sp. KHPX15 TaxID=1855342 RepID=UPI000895D816|nr:Ltp family lipoprotein [Oribacterium sp. KHPX15]SEA88126.1 YD repeat-containing protein [Oribacterium sp. KHPX15]
MNRLFLIILSVVMMISISSCGGGKKAVDVITTSEANPTEKENTIFESSRDTDKTNNAESINEKTHEDAPEIENYYTIKRDINGAVYNNLYGLQSSKFKDFTLDDRGNLASRKHDKWNYLYSFEYDNNNKLVRSIVDHLSYGIEDTTYKYNENGLLVEALCTKTSKDGKDVITYGSEYTYDDNNMLVSSIETNQYKTRFEHTYTYDDNGRIIRVDWLTISADGDKNSYYKDYVYEDDNLLFLSGDEQGVENIHHRKFNFDFWGNLLDWSSIDDGKPDKHSFIEYDKIGEVSLTAGTDPELIPADQWKLFDEELIPMPDTCINSIVKQDDYNYLLPYSNGKFLFIFDEPRYYPEVVDLSMAQNAVENYKAILEQLYGYDLTDNGDNIVIKKDEEIIAKLLICQSSKNGVTLKVAFDEEDFYVNPNSQDSNYLWQTTPHIVDDKVLEGTWELSNSLSSLGERLVFNSGIVEYSNYTQNKTAIDSTVIGYYDIDNNKVKLNLNNHETVLDYKLDSQEPVLSIVIDSGSDTGHEREYRKVSDESDISGIDYSDSSNKESEPSAVTAVSSSSGQQNALRKAQEYLENIAFSAKGLKEQLEYEGFNSSDAQYAVDNCGADWRYQAKQKALEYLKLMGFSRDGLIEQLEYDGFTKEEAEYGVNQAY